MRLQKLDFEALAQKKVYVVGPIYINELLVTGSPLTIEEFLIEEYKSVCRKHDVFHPVFLPMNEICERYPHLGEIIFNNLDDQSLVRSKEASRGLAEFLENGKQIRGKLNRDKHVFTIDQEALRMNSQKIGYPVDPCKVAEDFNVAMGR